VTNRVLLVEDDAIVRDAVALVLERHGYSVTPVADGADAIEEGVHGGHDLIVLDLMLPTVDGLDVCKEVRKSSRVPIVMLTARTDTRDVVSGLEAGADDYVVKPFKPQELLARIRARLRRTDITEPSQLRVGDLQIDVAGHSVNRGGEQLPLTPLEFDLLVALASRPTQVFDRESLLEKVWGYRHAGDTRLVNVHVQRLRSKIEKDPENPQIVLTVRGVGYKAGP